MVAELKAWWQSSRHGGRALTAEHDEADDTSPQADHGEGVLRPYVLLETGILLGNQGACSILKALHFTAMDVQ